MFDLQKIISFWSRFLGFHIFLIFGVFFLALLTEFFPQTAPVLSLQFWVGVIINIIPAIIVGLIVFSMAGRFTQAVYGLDNRVEGFQFVVRHRFGQSGFKPYLKVTNGQLPEEANPTLTRIGGPGSLIVSNDSAVVLEQAGRLTEVKKPGFHKLAPFEKIYDTVDLRPKRQLYPVSAMTKEGIPITWEVEVQYQIANHNQSPTEKTPYPFSEKDVFLAATCKWRRERDGGKRKDIMDWEKLVVESRIEGTLRSILAQHSLNELIGLTETETQAIREAVQEKLAQTLPEKIENLGGKILGIKLGKLEVDDQVTQQWIKAWQTRLKNTATLRFESVQAGGIPMTDMTKSEARMLPLTTIQRELEKQNPNQAITFMALTYFFFRLEGRLRLEAFSQFLQTDKSQTFPAPADLTDEPLKSQPKANNGPKSKSGFGKALPLPQAKFLRLLPILDEIAAGKPKPNLDDITGYIQQTGQMEFSLDNNPLTPKLLGGKSSLSFADDYGYVALKVCGDSMNLAEIAEGDYVILQKEKTIPVKPASGDIVAAVFRDEDNRATLKRLLIRPDGVTLKPESSNPAHIPLNVSRHDFRGDPPAVVIVGIAVAVLKH